jgi:polysaccharide pyruvyl transferase CsaB
VLISGYYGFGNLGDEALLDVIVQRLRATYPDGSIDVLSADPAGTTARLNVEATPRMDLGAVRRAIDRADVVLSGGGGLLQNVTSLRSLLYYAGIVRTATRAKKRTMIFAQSIGPLDVFGRAVVRACCGGVAAATVRDERSRKLLTSLLPNVRVERTADPVFLLEPDTAPLDMAAEGLGGPGPLVVVSVRRWQHNEMTVSAIAAAVDRLASEHGAQVAFLPLGGARVDRGDPAREVGAAAIAGDDPRPGGASDRPGVAGDRDAAARADHRRAPRRAVHRRALRSEGQRAARRTALPVAAALHAGR